MIPPEMVSNKLMPYLLVSFRLGFSCIKRCSQWQVGDERQVDGWFAPIHLSFAIGLALALGLALGQG